MIKRCEFCGKEFDSKSGNWKFCNDKHYKQCVICGTSFEVPHYRLGEKDLRNTCSRKCSAELRRQTNISKYGGPAPASSSSVRQKMQTTMMQRYGVTHAAKSEKFLAKTRATCREKFGADYYWLSDRYKQYQAEQWADPEFKAKRISQMQAGSLKKFGCISSFGDPEVRQKCSQTYYNKTGYYVTFANPEVQQKIDKTNLERYGVRRPIQSPKIQEQMKETCLHKYGTEYASQSPEIRARREATNIEKYGTPCYLQSDDCQRKLDAAIRSKYGDVKSVAQSREWKQAHMSDPSKVDELIAFESDPITYLETHYDHKPTLRELNQDLGVTSIGEWVNKFNLCDKLEYVYSYMEQDVFDFLTSLDPSMVIERNTHKIITPKELDIYLPEYRIGIECNPTATHNSSISMRWTLEDAPIPKNYHQVKTNLCEEQDIFLFHLFGFDWTHRRSIMESMIRNLLNLNVDKIYARKCVIRDVNAPDARKFLMENHRQGNANSPVRLGLYFDDMLVSLMTFGKMRSTIGTGKEDLSDCWELVRFCSKLNTTVVGGASKLFNHFIQHYSPNRVRSFSDRARTQGSLYRQLGFMLLHKSEPGYVWVDSRTDRDYNRYAAQKHNIARFLKDPDVDLTQSETQIMLDHKFLQVFDSGTILWEYRKPQEHRLNS